MLVFSLKAPPSPLSCDKRHPSANSWELIKRCNRIILGPFWFFSFFGCVIKPKNQRYEVQYRPIIFFKNRTKNIFSSNRSIWVQKFAEFYADFKSEDKIEKNAWQKSNYQKTPFLQVFFKYLFIGLLFLNFDFRFGISIKFCEFW